MRKLEVRASKNYEIHIGSGLLDNLSTYLDQFRKNIKICIVTDDNVEKYYLSKVRDNLAAAGYTVYSYVIENGEKSKNADNYLKILTFLIENGFTRSDALLALGGGVVGDLTGFVASTFMRGVKFYQVPTTVLAMVDSSVGGKTAIDLPVGKNLVGSFYQPDIVIMDTDTLKTLPEETVNDGFAEIIKYGVIYSAELFEKLKDRDNMDLEDILYSCVEIKRDVVMEDEKDYGIRQILNFGHTVGHAVEKNSHFVVTHGKAVAIGMCIISRAAAKMGICSEEVVSEVEMLVKKYSLPAITEYNADVLFDATFNDKKRSGSTINIIIPEKIGKVAVKTVNVSEMRNIISLGLDK